MNGLINQLKLVNDSFTIVNKPKILESDKDTIHIPYPCEKSYDCSPYLITLNPGIYYFKICAGNGGIKDIDLVVGYKDPDHPYAGGCSSGNLALKEKTNIYIKIGGKGSYGPRENISDRQYGGYNGGGRGNKQNNCGGGGGATDIRAEVNDVFHRILVAGGGGGGDDFQEELNHNNLNNDGRGGPGGGLEACGWISNSDIKIPLASQLKGFSFGTGEAPLTTGSLHEDGIPEHPTEKLLDTHDIGGGGGGWFGGFTSQRWNEGAGGGSSFALMKTNEIPHNEICEHTDLYEEIACDHYAYYQDRKYIFTDVSLERGAWYGDGFVDMSIIYLKQCTHKTCLSISRSLILNFILSILIS